MTTPPDNRTLEQRILAYLFPKQGPQDKSLQAHGAEKLDRINIGVLPESMQAQLVHLCDLSPTTAPDLVRFVSQAVYYGREAGHDEGYDEGLDSGIRQERRAVYERLRDLAKEWSTR